MQSACWQPGASLDMLKRRAKLLAQIRNFFADRLLLEVETPVLAGAGVTDPQLTNLITRCPLAGQAKPQTLYLQTSPEYAMKRLLAAHQHPIYQISKVFRDGESGSRHNPEFTLVEWYRPEFDMHDMMAEVEDLLIALDLTDYCDTLTYRDAFQKFAYIDPFVITDEALRAHVVTLNAAAGDWDRDAMLDFILSMQVAPQLGKARPQFLCHYPVSQAALAQVLPHDPPVAARFELFINGLELANGFQELAIPDEQRERFLQDNRLRKARGLPEIVLDEKMLVALYELPECSGVALGLDRLLMAMTGAGNIAEVMAFTTAEA